MNITKAYHTKHGFTHQVLSRLQSVARWPLTLGALGGAQKKDDTKLKESKGWDDFLERAAPWG